MMKFYVVGTPIGNLGDMTFRAVETLKSVDLILCEDTRVTKRLLDHFGINKPLLSYHQQSKLSKVDKIAEHIGAGKTLALVTDAGTPGLSDPGNELIEKILVLFPELEIVSIPGPSALTALVQVAGIALSKFLFMGFPPHKKGRETFLKKVVVEELPVVYYESPHRVIKNLVQLGEIAKDAERRKKLIVGRELTKIHEQVLRGDIESVLKYFEEHPDKVRGEFVIIAY